MQPSFTHPVRAAHAPRRLDRARHMIWERLRVLSVRGRTTFLTTHVMEEAKRLCDRLWVLERDSQDRRRRSSWFNRRLWWKSAQVVGADQALAEHVKVSGGTRFCYASNPKQVRKQLHGPSERPA